MNIVRSDVQPDRHHQVDEPAVVAGLDQAGAQRTYELQDQVVGLGALEALAQELGVEADLQRLALERDRQRLARLADVRRLRRHLEAPVREAHAQRRVLLREQADAAHDLGQLRAAHVQLVLELVRKQLLVVREAALDEARGERDLADAEDHLVFERGDLDAVAALGGRDAAELLQRARGDVRLERSLQRLLERGLLDAQAVGIGGDHSELLLRGRHEYAREVRTRLVARGGTGDAADRLHERLGGDAHDACVAGFGQLRELVGGQRAQVEARRPADHLDVALLRAVLERQVVLWERAHDVEQQSPRQNDHAGPFDGGLGANAHAEFHVGGLQLHAAFLRLEADAGERLDRATRGDAANGDAETADELFP